MRRVIVDTNVAIAANRQNDSIAQSCSDACIEFLVLARSNYIVLVDSDDEIRSEYAKAINKTRPYQLGAQFLIHLQQQMHNTKHVQQINLVKREDGSLVDFPTGSELDKFDRSDRKFAALGRKTKTAITNAVDGDWLDFLPALSFHGISVEFLCGSDRSAWFSSVAADQKRVRRRKPRAL